MKRKTPGFHEFIVRQLGEPKHVLNFARNWFIRPLCAHSFSRFWYYWNPAYGYVLLFYVYWPLRRYFPRPVALLATFLASGFLLHDLPFSISADIYRGHFSIPSVTILMFIFGIFVLIGEALHLDLSRHSPW